MGEDLNGFPDWKCLIPVKMQLTTELAFCPGNPKIGKFFETGMRKKA